MATIVPDQRRLTRALAEKNRREMLALRLYRPMPGQQEDAHRSSASERLIRGGNQSGKTMWWAIEVSSAATGIAITAADGTPIPFGYPRNRPLLIWVVGYDEKHIARIYRKLFTSGSYSFRIIKDLESGKWRAWKPADPADAARETESVPAPPLIPEEFIESFSWEKASEKVFSICRLKNGTEIHAFTSGSDHAGQGEPVDLIAIDEDVKYPQHVQEWQARLSLVRGRFIWAAWPHSTNDALRLITRRAEEQRGRQKPDVEEFLLTFSGNPYIPPEEKRKRLEGWAAAGEMVLQSRDQGEYADGNQLVYPGFNVETHGMPRKDGPDAIEVALALNGWRPPPEWTHYLGIDPGHTNAAVVFVAVPPPVIGNYFVVYDEVFAQRCEPKLISELIARKSQGITFHAFIIDAHAGRQTESGSGKRTVEFWREAFAIHGLKSRLTDTGFLAGSDNIGARNMVVRDWMLTRADGTTQFRMVSDNTPYLRREFGLYKKKINRDDVSEDVRRRDNHGCDAMAYVAAYLAPMFDDGSAYFAPPPQTATVADPAVEWRNRIAGVKQSSKQEFYFGAGAVPTAA